MSSVSVSRSLLLPVSGRKIVKVQAVNRVVALTEQQTVVVATFPLETGLGGEYIAAEKLDYTVGSARIEKNQMTVVAKQLNFYQQHQALEIRSRAALGLHIDCLL